MAGTRRSVAARLGGWSTRHRKTAVIGWLLFVFVASGVGGMQGLHEASQAELDAGDSARARQILEDAGINDPADEMVMVTSGSEGRQVRVARELMGDIKETGKVQGVSGPLRSEDGKSALITFEVKGKSDTAADRVQPVLDVITTAERDHDDVSIHQFGEASAEHWLDDLMADDFKKAEWTAVPLALGILLIAFGALVAALLPVLLAMTAFVAASGLLALVSVKMHMFETTSSVMLLIGLAVGIDYCLFYLRRERDERASGRDPEAALRIAADTSGRAVLVSGFTVIVAMSGMFLSGLLIFKGFAVATILVVFIAMVGSVTVLPAMLSLLGDRVNKGKVPFLGGTRRRGPRRSGAVAGALLWPVLAAPGLFLVLATGALLAMAYPALDMKTEQLGPDKQLPSSAPLRDGYERISKTFPGGPAPATVVVSAEDITAPGTKAALADFTRAARGSEDFGKGVRTVVYQEQNVAEIRVPLAGDGADARSKAALSTLRDDLVPGKLAPAVSHAYVTGELASSVDFNDQLGDSILPVFLFIVGVTFLIMLVSFHSLPIAIVSVLLNTLSVVATYGVLVGIFQRGWAADRLNTEPVGVIEAWMPLFILVVLFGLSMDYHVFVVSRIREMYDRGVPTREAIRQGVRATSGAITGAAVIMIALFSVFATLSMQDMKQMGIGLAVAVLLDATIIRMVLLPSCMMLLGEKNWYMPRVLRWLPHLSHGASPEAEEAPRAETQREPVPTTAR
ncbi:MMPL family transporter [Streptomyces boncukensis]|uniref:MMPL family transporter n=1 Tax=Streptomyces boncukensis TaxID=2711219 RepID=A0A6G4WU99_9ACTN|nr:MMPL family transporter [Streptomyces boncukensis]NGO68859.1 MMPL family transporter [Streptomyces boncukensis]